MRVKDHAKTKHIVNLGYHMTSHGIAYRTALGLRMTMPRKMRPARGNKFCKAQI